MTTNSKLVGVSACCVALCVGLSYADAAHPQAEPHPSDDRGSQGNQEAIKGDSTPKRSEDEKVDEAKLKEAKKSLKRRARRRRLKGRCLPS